MGKVIELVPSITTEDVVLNKGAGYTPDFKLYTAGIESDRSNNRLVHMVGSSTEQDMQGDVMTLYALNDMTKAASNMTIWLNHNYDLPDSIFGSVVGNPTIKHQNGVADLHLSVDVELDNPSAARVKRYIDNGRRLGCSIGCMVTKYEVPDETDGPDWAKMPIKILGVYVVEYSVVGIPCNQRSWVENAISGVFTRTLDPHLAPAMKALWPSRYKALAKSFDAETQERMSQFGERERPESRLEWHTPTKQFLLTHQGKEKFLAPEAVKALFAGEASVPATNRVEPDLVDSLEDIHVEDLDGDDLDLEKGVCGKTSWPLNMEASWDKTTAHHALLAWAGGKENFQPSKFKSTHFWYDNDGTKISDFHYPFCNVSGGKVEAIWHAITAAAAALGGARSGTDSGGHGAIRSKLAVYYRKAGKPIPWESGDSSESEKALDDEEITQKNEEAPELEKVAAASNGDNNGKKKPKPTDDNPDPDHDGDDDRTAEGDTDHDYHKKPKGGSKNDNQDGEDDAADQSSDDEEDDNDGKGKKKPAKGEKGVDASSLTSKTIELSAPTVAMLDSYNTLAKALNLPELSAEHYTEIQAGTKSVHVDGQHLHHLQILHDAINSMSGGMTCGAPSANQGQSFQEASNQAAEISGQTPAMGPMYNALGEHVAKITKSVEVYSDFVTELQKARDDRDLILKEIQKAREAIPALYAELGKYNETVAAIKDMPLGNPKNHRRTIRAEDREATVSYEELLGVSTPKGFVADSSLTKAFELTRVDREQVGGMFMEYRYWPEGVGGSVEKGVRPALTSDQITFMSFSDIEAYRAGKEAKVPHIDNQVKA